MVPLFMNHLRFNMKKPNSCVIKCHTLVTVCSSYRPKPLLFGMMKTPKRTNLLISEDFQNQREQSYMDMEKKNITFTLLFDTNFEYDTMTIGLSWGTSGELLHHWWKSVNLCRVNLVHSTEYWRVALESRDRSTVGFWAIFLACTWNILIALFHYYFWKTMLLDY